ncbi:hypothetical protein BGX28_004507 [Mortierella sp. GBA30]|nr:hypothetical protein BGX28_004507 [Mortierella sp. GBA30]
MQSLRRRNESTSFSVDINSNKIVDNLKDAIKHKIPDTFSGVDAKDLTLWKVSIPVVRKKDRKEISLADVLSKEELDGTDDVSDVFKETPPKKTIHIIVQRPAPVRAPVPARSQTPVPLHARDVTRSSTPISTVFIPMDQIEAELEDILKNIPYNHATDVIDPKAVEASQREKLGRFYKRPLPYHKTATDINLAKTSEGETLLDIVKDDVGKYTDHRVVAMVAPSGSGKTATMVDLASRHLVIYCVCCVPSATISPGFKDPNFVVLAKDVERIYTTITEKEHGSWRQPQDIDYMVKDTVGDRVEIEFLARILFLLLLLNKNPELDPQQFFREQTTEGSSVIQELVHKLKEYDNRTIQAMLGRVQTKIRSLLLPRRLGVVVALDEAQVAANRILTGKLISPSGLIRNKNILFDKQGSIQPEFRRGFLTPLSATLSNMQATLVILGTALSLQDADHVYSAIAKPTNFSRITEFPKFSESDVDRILSDLTDMGDCAIPEAKRRKLAGRARFSIDVVNRLTKASSPEDSKQAVLDNAIDRSIEHTMDGLRRGVRTVLSNDPAGGLARLLCRMVLAYHLRGGKISFASKEQADFVDNALCRLQPHPDCVHLVLDEPMVVEAVEEELNATGKDPAFIEYMDQMYQLSPTSKGDAFEPLVCRSLQRFNGCRLVDLPFLRAVSLPSWCDNFKLQIDEINTANGFGYSASGVRADLAFLTECPPNKMLVAMFGTRPDGAWFFSDTQYDGSLAIKPFSDRIKQDIHESNETSSDIRGCFLKKDGATVTKSLAPVRQAFVDSGIPSNLKGTLRIHLEFPGVQNGYQITHIRKDPATGIEDVMVYINLSNLDDFFFEGISEGLDDMVKLKTLIKFISISA